jgi:uncharacterized phiE125 gp8 family phage protein
MRYSLKIITPPEIEPVTVAEVKLHTHINHDVEDSLISGWIKSGRELAEEYHGYAYLQQKCVISFDTFPCLPLRIPMSPLVSIDSIKYYDDENQEQEIDLSQFVVDTDSIPGRIAFLKNTYSWPNISNLRPIDSVKIAFTCGMGMTAESVPAKVKDAIMLYCAHRNENRAAEGAPPQFYSLLRADRVYPS